VKYAKLLEKLDAKACGGHLDGARQDELARAAADAIRILQSDMEALRERCAKAAKGERDRLKALAIMYRKQGESESEIRMMFALAAADNVRMEINALAIPLHPEGEKP